MFLLDTLLVAGLLLAAGRRAANSFGRWHAYEVSSVLAMAALGFVLTAPALAEGRIVRVNSPEAVYTHAVSMVQQSSLAGALSSGEWRVLFHRPGCEACRESVAAFERSASDAPLQLAMIEVVSGPRDPSAKHAGVVPPDGLARGWLQPSDSFVKTPLLIEVRDGAVTRVNFRGSDEEGNQ